MFSAELCFSTFDDAKAAEAELREAGFHVKILDEVDIYSPAAFMEVREVGDEKQIEDIIDPWDGDIIEYRPDHGGGDRRA